MIKSKVLKCQINVKICQIVHLGFGLIVQSPNRWQGTQWMELALGTSAIAARNGGRLLIYESLSNATVSVFYIVHWSLLPFGKAIRPNHVV